MRRAMHEARRAGRLLLMVAALVPAVAAAQFQELENAGPVTAVQERSFRLMNEIDLGGGVLPLDPFTKGLYAYAAYGFHFTDWFGWQVRGGYVYSARTDLRMQLERDFGQPPTAFEQIQFFAGSDAVWTPFYGKVSVVNRFVIHGEFFLLAGGTVFRFSHDAGLGLRPAVNLGGGLRIFLSRYFSVRFDVGDNIVIPLGNKAKGLGNVLSVTLSLGINLGATE